MDCRVKPGNDDRECLVLGLNQLLLQSNLSGAGEQGEVGMWWRRRQNIAEPLIDFWSELRGTVHPRDQEILEGSPNTLRTQFPGPAFVGDIRSARVFFLYANGGYDPVRTPKEFEKISAEEYRQRLRNPVPCDDKTSVFFQKGRLGKLLREGKAAVVNAMAYRSPKISHETEKDNRVIAEKLPSVQFHRKWLHSHLLPAAGEVMVVVHRPALWRLNRSRHENNFVLFPRASLYSYPPNWVFDRADAFLVEPR
jgi:hypothetical protein